jgi:hypothetical protein
MRGQRGFRGNARATARLCAMILVSAGLAACAARDLKRDVLQESASTTGARGGSASTSSRVPATGSSTGTDRSRRPLYEPSTLVSTLQAAPRGEWVFADLPDPTPQRESDGTIELIEVRRFGAENGPGWLGRIDGAAANDSVVVVADTRACEIVVFARRSSREIARFGKCGQGPGEFQQINTVALKQDTIVVADRNGARLQYLANAGTVLRTVRLAPSVLPRVARLQRISWIGDTLMLLSVMQGGHRAGSNGDGARDPAAPFVRAVPVGDQLATRYGVIVEGRAVGKQSFGQMRETAACHIPSANSSAGPEAGGFIVASNEWHAQTAVLDVDSLARQRPSLVLNHTVPSVTGHVPLDSKLMPGSKETSSYDFACSATAGYFESRRNDDPAPESRLATSGWLIVVDPVERKQAVKHLTGAQPAALGRIVAAHGNSIFYMHNSRYDYPQIVEMRATVRWKR